MHHTTKEQLLQEAPPSMQDIQARYELTLQPLEFDPETEKLLRNYLPQRRDSAELHTELIQNLGQPVWMLTSRGQRVPHTEHAGGALYALKTGVWPALDMVNPYNALAGTFMWAEPKPKGRNGLDPVLTMRYLQGPKQVQVRAVIHGQLHVVGAWHRIEIKKAEALYAELLSAPWGTEVGEPCYTEVTETPRMLLQRLTQELKTRAVARIYGPKPVWGTTDEEAQTTPTRTGTLHTGPKYYTFLTETETSTGPMARLSVINGLVTLTRPNGSTITYTPQ